MTSSELKSFVIKIVEDASALKNRHTSEIDAPVNYACIFAQSDKEYSELTDAVKEFGKVVKETNSGFVYHINDLPTPSGNLRILKIRIPDPTKPERGDADFTVSNYSEFKKMYLPISGFKLIERSYMEMIELMEDGCDVRVYFSDPPVDRQLLDS